MEGRVSAADSSASAPRISKQAEMSRCDDRTILLRWKLPEKTVLMIFSPSNFFFDRVFNLLYLSCIGLYSSKLSLKFPAECGPSRL